MKNYIVTSYPVSHNVPAVYDGFLCPIKERGAFQGTKNCGWSGAWEA
jgi:hypothetical protein